MSYQQYGISPQLVERIKLKMKNRVLKERVKQQIEGVTKADLQNKAKVRHLVKTTSAILNERLTATQEELRITYTKAHTNRPATILILITPSLRLWNRCFFILTYSLQKNSIPCNRFLYFFVLFVHPRHRYNSTTPKEGPLCRCIAVSRFLCSSLCCYSYSY